MRAKVFYVAGLAAVLGAVLSPAASADPSQPKPVSLAQAQALSSAPGRTLGVSIHRVTAQEALAAASRSGASTEVASGLTLGQAVGMASSPAADAPTVRRLSRATAAQTCWSGQESVSWGIWPYNQVVYDNTYWCAYIGGAITYRSTNVTHGSALCNGSGDYTFRISGGAGYAYVAYQVGAYFSCQTDIPWITINTSRSFSAEVNNYGSMFIYQIS